MPSVDPRRLRLFALRTIVATVRQYSAFARESRVMLDWNLRTEDFECSLDNEDSAGLSYLLCTAERQRQTAHYQLVGVGKAC